MHKLLGKAVIVFQNGPNPASFIIYFWSFQTNIITIFKQIYVKKCPSNIQCRDLDPQPSELESPPKTTRPELPPKSCHCGTHVVGFATVALVEVGLLLLLLLPLLLSQLFLLMPTNTSPVSFYIEFH